MKLLIAIFILVAAIVFTSFKSKGVNVAQTLVDTTPKKQYQYFFVIKLTPQEWQASTDTLGLVISNFGKSMSVDGAELYKQAYIRQLNGMAQKIKIDSVLIK